MKIIRKKLIEVKKQTGPPSLNAMDLWVKGAMIHPIMSRDEQRKRAKGGTIQDRNALVNSNLRYVLKYVSNDKVLLSLARNRGVKMTDLLQAGAMGMMRAAERYNGIYSFITYARQWVRAYAWREVKKNGSIKVDILAIEKIEVRTLALELYNKSQKKIDEGLIAVSERRRKLVLEIIEKMRDPEKGEGFIKRAQESVNMLVNGLNAVNNMDYIDEEIETDDGSTYTMLDTIPTQPKILEELERKERIDMLEKAVRMRSFNNREKLILEQRILSNEPETLQRLSEKLNITRERVRQIEKGVKIKIKKALEKLEKESEEKIKEKTRKKHTKSFSKKKIVERPVLILENLIPKKYGNIINFFMEAQPHEIVELYENRFGPNTGDIAKMIIYESEQIELIKTIGTRDTWHWNREGVFIRICNDLINPKTILIEQAAEITNHVRRNSKNNVL